MDAVLKTLHGHARRVGNVIGGLERCVDHTQPMRRDAAGNWRKLKVERLPTGIYKRKWRTQSPVAL